MKAKYINPFTDFGFKKIFGEEASKPLLLDFLNALLPEIDRIAKLSFKNNEQLGQTEFDRKAIYDIYCENEHGEKFIVELQKVKQNYFKERTIYYSTFPIQEQAEKGEWNYNLKAVYCIGILDFTFDDYENKPEKSEVIHSIKLKNQNGKTFYDKLTYIYLEMPNFKKTESNLKSRIDQWLYFIKYLEDFQTIPAIFNDEVFSGSGSAFKPCTCCLSVTSAEPNPVLLVFSCNKTSSTERLCHDGSFFSGDVCSVFCMYYQHPVIPCFF